MIRIIGLSKVYGNVEVLKNIKKKIKKGKAQRRKAKTHQRNHKAGRRRNNNL